MVVRVKALMIDAECLTVYSAVSSKVLLRRKHVLIVYSRGVSRWILINLERSRATRCLRTTPYLPRFILQIFFIEVPRVPASVRRGVEGVDFLVRR